MTDVLDLAVAGAPGTPRPGGRRLCVLPRRPAGARCRGQEIGGHAGHEGGIVWLGLHKPDEALLSAIQAELGLHELIVEDANQRITRGAKIPVALYHQRGSFARVRRPVRHQNRSTTRS